MLESAYGTRPDLLPQTMVRVVRAAGPGERLLGWSGRTGVELLDLAEHLRYERDTLGRFPRRSDGAIEWNVVDQSRVIYSADGESVALQDVVRQHFQDGGSLVFFMDSLAIPTVRMEFEQAVTHLPNLVESVPEFWICSPDKEVLLEYAFAGAVTVARIPARASEG
jgi:hypothetical protein